MSATNIEWTDRVWNPVTGCTKVSAGCKFCYAETIANRRLPHGGFTDRPFTEVRTHEGRLSQPLSWRKPSRVFVNSMSDLFHEDVSFEFIDRVFSVMGLSEHHTFQILTKRAARMHQYMTTRPASLTVPGEVNITTELGLGVYHVRWPLPNVWLGVSVENQQMADERIPLLLQTPAAQRFLSCEPLLSGLDIAKHRPGANRLWVIVGGESGPGARPCHIWWIRNVVGQCRDSDVPVFVKQLGSHVIDRNDAGFEGDPGDSWTPETRFEDLTAEGWQGDPVRIRLRDRKGGAMEEWPKDLRVRELPA